MRATGTDGFFCYDPQYQLTKAEYPAPTPFNGEIHSWSYDAIGNRLTNTVNAATQTYAYLKNGQNPLNGQKLANDGTSAYSYDFNGNTLTRTGYGFGYDAENRLTSITGNETAGYTYDYQGRRTSKTVGGVTTTYLYDGLNLIAETAAGQTSYYLNGAGIDDVLAMSKGGQIAYFSVDGLGSVVATDDAAGSVTHSVVFDAWGNTKSEVGTRVHPFTYTGREIGEGTTLFYRARSYLPGIGRFSSEDPIGFAGSFPSLYRYVSNAPFLSVDPLGLTDLVIINKEREPETYRNMAAIPSPPGFFSIGSHGWPEGPLQGLIFDQRRIPLDKLIKLMKEHGWKPGTPVAVFACRTGDARNYMQALADELGVYVVAPTGRIATFSDGSWVNTLAPKDWLDSRSTQPWTIRFKFKHGGWTVFKPQAKDH